MLPGDDAQVCRNFDWQHFLFPSLPEIIPRKQTIYLLENNFLPDFERIIPENMSNLNLTQIHDFQTTTIVLRPV